MWAGPLFEGHICSVGYEVLDWIHEYTCHGVGDIQGEPLDLDDEMRDHIMESLNYQLRKVTKNRGHFPSEQAALKCLCRVT